jgi:hypothetical protein
VRQAQIKLRELKKEELLNREISKNYPGMQKLDERKQGASAVNMSQVQQTI